MNVLYLPSSKSNYEVTYNLDGIDYVFLFHWNGRTNHWYYRISFTDGTVIQGDKKLNPSIRVNKDVNENTPPGWLVSYMPKLKDSIGLFDLDRNFVFVYITEEEIFNASR